MKPDPLVDVLEQRADQGLPVGKVPVHGAFGDLGCRRDLGERDVVPTGDQIDDRVEDAVA